MSIKSDAIRHIEHYRGPLDIVLDVGAYHGDLAIEADKLGGDLIVAVEAGFVNYWELLEIISTNGNRIIPMYACVVKEIEHGRKFFERGPTSSFYIEAEEFTLPPQIPFVQLLGLFDHVDYLKIDIENTEHEIFDGSDRLRDALRMVRFLDLEIHHMSNARQIYEFLRSCGFTDEPNEAVVAKHGLNAFGSYNRKFNA
jgi:FkbM family methyltransferase